MERMNSVGPELKDDASVDGDQEFDYGRFPEMWNHLEIEVSKYVRENPQSTNTQLFSFLALLNSYLPESYLMMSECQEILGPPDPIFGGPPFEERMEPFTLLIKTPAQSTGNVCIAHPLLAHKAVRLLAASGIANRSVTVKKFMSALCRDQPEPHILQFIRDLLTKREGGEKRKQKFSWLILDICFEENFYNAVSVLKTASDKLRQNPIFPQTLARLFYIEGRRYNFRNAVVQAEYWAKRAIRIAPNNSYVADTLGQVYKSCLMRETRDVKVMLSWAEKALRAFKDVEMKAEKEEGPDMWEAQGTISISDSFNNRGRFGFFQVAKIIYEKLHFGKSDPFFQILKEEVEAKFGFFEWYLAYSKPDETSTEPYYFWKDIALCYEYYTSNKAAESTSFPGLLDCLSHGLFTSKEKRAGFEQGERTVSDLEEIRGRLKGIYENNVDNVKAAERYILSNIILSNKNCHSHHLTPVKVLQTIISRFLRTDMSRRSPEFYLLVLLLFWPEHQTHVVQEDEDEEDDEEDEDEEDDEEDEDDGSEDRTWEDGATDEEEEASGATAQQSPEPMLFPVLQDHVNFMEKAFERCGYAKYLRGRYLLPLFFLGKGSGLSKWIHRSRLDAIVENVVDAEPAGDQNDKWQRINDLWTKGGVWKIPEVQNILRPVQVERSQFATMSQEHKVQEVWVCSGGEHVVRVNLHTDPDPALSATVFYLGFTIQGPILFSDGEDEMSQSALCYVRTCVA